MSDTKPNASQDPDHLSQPSGSINQQGDSVMSVQPIISSTPFVPATIPFGNGAGHTTAKILLNTVTGHYHCADCDYTAPEFRTVFPHRRAHAKPKSPKVADLTAVDMIVKAASLLTDAYGLITAEPVSASDKVDAEWKARALAAEKSLKSLRRILGSNAA